MHSIASDGCPVPLRGLCLARNGRRPEGGARIRAASWLGQPEGPLQEADSALDNALASGLNGRAGPAAPLPLLAAQCNSDRDRPPGTS